eukprot:31337-Eustigmatos_ZCMA.PRE.1
MISAATFTVRKTASDTVNAIHHGACTLLTQSAGSPDGRDKHVLPVARCADPRITQALRERNRLRVE